MDPVRKDSVVGSQSHDEDGMTHSFVTANTDDMYVNVYETTTAQQERLLVDKQKFRFYFRDFTRPILELQHVKQSFLDVSEMSHYASMNHSLDCFKNYSFAKLSINAEYKQNYECMTDIHELIKEGAFVERTDNTVYWTEGNTHYFCVRVMSCTYNTPLPIGQCSASNIPILVHARCLSPVVHNPWLRLVLYLWKFASSYAGLVSIIFDVLLACNVYYHFQRTYFIISITLIFIAMMACWFIGCCFMYDNRDIYKPMTPRIWFCLPGLSMIAVVSEFLNQSVATVVSVVLSSFLTYPQYILNLSYILNTTHSYKDISVYCHMQLITSFLVLIVSPFTNWMTHISSSNYFEECGLMLSIKDKCKVFAYLIAFLMPLYVCEIIHFFPLLFSYFIDKTITMPQMLFVLLIFNVPKVFIFVHLVMKKRSSSFSIWNDILWIPFILFIVAVLPLVPYCWFWLRKLQDINCNEAQSMRYEPLQESEKNELNAASNEVYAQSLISKETTLKRKNWMKENIFSLFGYQSDKTLYYWILLMYCYGSYGGMTAVIYYDVWMNGATMSFQVMLSLYMLIGFTVWITISLPFSIIRLAFLRASLLSIF